jgi:hypothetical protein
MTLSSILQDLDHLASVDFCSSNLSSKRIGVTQTDRREIGQLSKPSKSMSGLSEHFQSDRETLKKGRIRGNEGGARLCCAGITPD